ncbi:glycosyltransferase [Nostocoides sp. HKS02]|uniref:glycosyltransferase n=1 Tax=Nostocoides sp. HKS02 TaxID=1813880 RepID=UPI0018A86E7A|nr:glycosyltransferase [Tetrasphaera sp. HKS02]
MSVDVCVVTYNSGRTFPQLVASVEAYMPQGTRILVRDNSPKPGLLDDLERRVSSGVEIHVVGQGDNVGFGRACNELASASDRPWILFLNPDAELLTPLPSTVGADPLCMIGPLVESPSGQTEATFGPDRSMWFELKQRVLRTRVRLDPDRPIDFVSGACFAISRERFLGLGGFDDRYFMYYEDIDLGRRWRGRGGQILIERGWRVRHIGGASANAAPLTALVRSYQSACRYHQRWHVVPQTFKAICVVEAALKLTLALIAGRVGKVDRNTQWGLFKYVIASPWNRVLADD